MGAFVPNVPGDLRTFSSDPLALPPYPCRLCSRNFGTEEAFQGHVAAEHAGCAEYRKRVIFLESSFAAVKPVPPQIWRHCVEACTEDLVSGSSSWPSCTSSSRDVPSSGSVASSAAPAWWSDCDASSLGVHGLASDPGVGVDLGRGRCAVNARLLPENRQGVRCLLACVVCARRDWSSERTLVHLFRRPPDSLHPLIVHEEPITTAHATSLGGPDLRTHRDAVSYLLFPERYYRRYCFSEIQDQSASPGAAAFVPSPAVPADTSAGQSGAEPCAGVPLEELVRSSVRDPVSGRFWLLHRKGVRYSQGQVDDHQALPVCQDCQAALCCAKPRMPRFALANDNGIGRMPGCLSSLSVVGAMLLPLSVADSSTQLHSRFGFMAAFG